MWLILRDWYWTNEEGRSKSSHVLSWNSVMVGRVGPVELTLKLPRELDLLSRCRGLLLELLLPLPDSLIPAVVDE